MNALEIANLSYRYPDGTQALRNLTFSVKEGEIVGVIGPNGAGKSTLFLHLNGLLPQRFGEEETVRVFGLPVSEPNLDEIRAAVGLLFQDPDDQLFCPTVREDVAFGPSQMGISDAEISARVTKALQQVGLSEFEDRTPHHLSRGEKRRICLAGVLACNARILVLDEPTSDLDPMTKRDFRALLRTIESTKMISTHDLEFVAELCSRVILLDKGKIVADGPSLELLSDQSLMIAHGLEVPHIIRHLHPH